MLNDKLDQALVELIKQWNIAERRIKKAEQVRANEVVASAIFELRYAGRKIIDSIDLALKNDLAKNPNIEERVAAYIADATEDCVKAKHDAIDAMMNFVTTWFDEIEQKLGLAEIPQYFPTYLEITSRIGAIQDMIADSRGDRLASRDGIYDEIEKEGFDSVLALFDSMKRSKERMALAISAKARRETIMVVVNIASAIFGLVGIGLAIYFYLKTIP